MKFAKFCLCMLVIMISLGLSGCLEGENDYSKQGVCVVENTSLRLEPSTKGKWLSSLALGETVKVEGKPIKDEANPKVDYIKVKLSDGSQGYVSNWCIVNGAYVGVIQDTTKIYRRPDLLAETNQKFELMNIVAVEEEKDDWIRVIGEGRSKTGWIQSSSIRKDKEDVVTAVLLRKAMRGKGKDIPREEMEAIVSQLPYEDSYFVNAVMSKYENDAFLEDYDEEASPTNFIDDTTDSPVTE